MRPPPLALWIQSGGCYRVGSSLFGALLLVPFSSDLNASDLKVASKLFCFSAVEINFDFEQKMREPASRFPAIY